MNEALRKAVESDAITLSDRKLDAWREMASEWEDSTPVNPKAFLALIEEVQRQRQALRDQEAELATHRANYDALVIRLGEVTARLEAMDGLLLRYAIIVGELSKGLDHIDPIWGEVLQVATAYDNLKAADHV